MPSGRGIAVLGAGIALWLAARIIGSPGMEVVGIGLAVLPFLAGAFVWWGRTRIDVHRRLTDRPMDRNDALRMIKRRARTAGLSAATCCHTFRATGITAYLENGGTIENAQAIAAHESPRTTKLYDRTSDEITLDEVERIVI